MLTCPTCRCIGCGAPATRLCDARLGYLTGKHRDAIPRGWFNSEEADTAVHLTCDLPVCDDCTQGTPMFICGTDGCIIDSSDLCPVHAQSSPPMALFTEASLAAWRRSHRRPIEITPLTTPAPTE